MTIRSFHAIYIGIVLSGSTFPGCASRSRPSREIDKIPSLSDRAWFKELKKLSGEWRSVRPEDQLTLNFDYRILTISSKAKGVWKDLDGYKQVVGMPVEFLHNGDLFMFEFDLDDPAPRKMRISREIPLNGTGCEQIDLVKVR